ERQRALGPEKHRGRARKMGAGYGDGGAAAGRTARRAEAGYRGQVGVGGVGEVIRGRGGRGAPRVDDPDVEGGRGIDGRGGRDGTVAVDRKAGLLRIAGGHGAKEHLRGRGEVAAADGDGRAAAGVTRARRDAGDRGGTGREGEQVRGREGRSAVGR